MEADKDFIKNLTAETQSAGRKEHSAWRKALTDNRSTDDRKTVGSEQTDVMRRALILTQHSELSPERAMRLAI